VSEEPPAVLVVEDQRGLADLFSFWLVDDYPVRTAYDAVEALDMLDDDVGVVLLDRRMPEMTGDEFLRRIRSLGFDCPVAIVSAVTPTVDILEMGFDDYLVKPVSRDELRQTVERLLDRRAYEVQVRELFSLLAKQAALQETHSETKLERRDEYETLIDRIEVLKTETGSMGASFSHDDFRATLARLETTSPSFEASQEQFFPDPESSGNGHDQSPRSN
jgi:DNA-binding response OmpR family regulator